MNRSGNSHGLPMHVNSRRQSSGGPLTTPGSTSPLAKRMNSAKLFVLIGLCVVSLLAVSRMFTPQQEDGSLSDPSSEDNNDNGGLNQDSSQRDRSDEVERARIVKHYFETRKSAFRFEDFTDEGLVQSGNEHLLPATAILLGWKRIDDLKLIVAYLVRYPYIKQIIVWNNNRDVHLTKQEFLDAIKEHLTGRVDGPGSINDRDLMMQQLPQLDVFNGVENMHNMAKYMSCSLAKHDYCYFQDDNWLNTHMDALYTNFLTAPELIHTNTLPVMHKQHRQWTFTNENYNMHTGFSSMGTGSFLPKAKAKRLLQQRTNTTLAKDRYKVIDTYFSIWTNQYPYQLVSYPTPLDQKSDWSSEEVINQRWSIVFRNMLDAADRLYSALLSNFEVTNKDFFVREEEKPYVKDRHSRSPCYNDRCLFMTNIDPLPNPSDVVFEGKLKTMEDQEEKFSLLNQPTDQFLGTFSYMFAVDNDPLTCWNSFKVPQAGDSFGLRFVKPTALKYWTITSAKALTGLEGQITVLASDHRGVHWTICPHTARYPFAHTMILDINCPLTTTTLPGGMIQMVKVQLDVDLEKSLDICGMDAGGMIL